MPVICADYDPFFFFKNPHINTVWSFLFGNLNPVSFSRRRLETADNDFIDLDFSSVGSQSAVILLHGLEGSSKSQYIQRMTQLLNQNMLDVIVMNFRGCSGEPNRLYSSYHSGKTDDLAFVISSIEKQYKSLYLIGFSLGGNIVLKHLGEVGSSVNPKIKKAIAISTPCDLKSSAEALGNSLYARRLIKQLKKKVVHKCATHGVELKQEKFHDIVDFKSLDDLYTAPAHGFKNAEDYWNRCSSIHFLDTIHVPTLIINAKDDPFLGKECFPYAATENSFISLTTPQYGGHVGFNRSLLPSKSTWVEEKVISFLC